jgi:putative ABC transport system permease protein
MIRPRWQKVFSDLWGNPLRSLLVIASIAVGLYALGVMATIYFVALNDMQTGYSQINPANLYFSTSPLDRGLVERIAELPGVKAASGMRLAGLRLKTGPARWEMMDVHGLRDPGSLEINQLLLVEGKWPPGERELVLDRYKLSNANAKLGDLVTIELPSGATRAMRLVGIVQDQTIGAFHGAGGFFNAPIQAYVHQDTLEWLEQPLPKTFNNLYVTVEGNDQDKAHLAQIAAEVRARLENNGVVVVSTALRSSTEHPNLYLAAAILAVLVVIGLLVVFLSGFLITNTLQALLNQQVTQIGILKTVGARRFQIVGIYLGLNLIFGLLAFAIALPLSFLTAFAIVEFLTVQMNHTFFGFRIVPQVVWIELAIAILMPQIAALLPVWQGTRISVQEALSGILQSSPPGRGLVDRFFGRLRQASLLLVISLRNTFRRKFRLLLTVITLTLGGAVFIATFNVRVSLTNYVNQIIQYFLADVNITLDRSYRLEEMQALIGEVEGVAQVEGWAFARTEIVNADGTEGESVSLLAPPAASPLVKPILIEGRWIQPGDRGAIALSELFRDAFPGIGVGDTLRLKVNGKESDFTVVGFFQLAGRVSGFSAYTTYEYLTELTHTEGRAAAFRVVSPSPNLTRTEQEVLGQRIEAHLDGYGIRVVDVTTGRALSEVAGEGFNVLTAFLLFLALLTALVGSIGLTGTMSLNVMERTREIGVLRAIGAADRVLLRMVLTEGALIGLLSWMLASAAAFPISSIMAESISQSLFGGSSQFGFTPIGFVVWLAIVVALSVLASVMPARGATRLTIREVLAYE